MEKPFLFFYQFFEKRRGLFWGVLVLGFLTTGFFAAQLRLEEDISKVLPRSRKTESLNQVFQNSRFVDRLVITVSPKDSTAALSPDSLVAFAEAFAQRADEKLKPYLGKTAYKVDDEQALNLFSRIRESLPLYLTEADYRAMDSLISPTTLRETLARNYRTLTSPTGLVLKQFIAADPVGLSTLGYQKLQQLQFDANFELYNGYVISKDHRHLLLFVSPAFPTNNTGQNERLLLGLDDIIADLSENRQATATYFGATVVAVGNALQIRQDAQLTQGVTVLFLVVFIGLYFRKKRAPLLVLVPVVFGGLFSAAVLFFLKGQVSVIALATGSIILGVAVNYSLHVFNHYRHTRDIRAVIADLALPLTVGSFTTIGGFLCLQFVESELLRDLGLFAAFALIGAALASLIFLPHLLTMGDDPAPVTAQKSSWIDRIAAYRLEYSKPLLAVIVVLTGVFAYTAHFVGFETNVLHMNFRSEQTRRAETALNRLTAYSLQSVYVVSQGRDLDDALRQNERAMATVERLQRQGFVRSASGVASLLPSDSLQKARIQRWNAYWTPEKKADLLATLRTEGAALGFRETAFVTFGKFLNANFQPLDRQQRAALRETALDEYLTETPGRATVVTLLKVAPQHNRRVYAAFEDSPQTSVVDKQALTNQLVKGVEADFQRIAWMTSLLVFTVLLLTYGRVELALVSFVPMAITWVWILGIMGIFGIQFNIVNIIISALIFGLGDDYSLFIMDGLLQEYRTGKQNLASYKSSILLSGITTMAGLGALIFAKHPALKSIAVISIVGIGCVVLISQVLIPFFFRLLIKNRTEKGQFPWTMSKLLKSAFALTYFVLGCLILTILGPFFTLLNPVNRGKSRYGYHVLLSTFAKSMIYVMGNVKKTILNPAGEAFSKPAVLICNHQSVLDILLTLMLHPKVILLTNHWVWNSPLFGAVARMADFYPVDEGVEKSLPVLAKKVAAGYSLVVFPEGTRSVDGTLGRFHKGAFFLAEKLHLDLLPLVLHGTGYVMSKGDFMVKDGTLTVQFLPRIHPDDPRWGQGYAERTKAVGRYFRAQYGELKTKVETPDYHRERLLANYLYKGPVLEWYMRIKTGMEKNYRLFDQLVPRDARVLDIGCGYGFMSYLLSFSAPERRVTGIDYDEEKIAVANHCFAKTEHIQFSPADVLTYRFATYDTIILSDVLHYLQPAQQQTVLETCVNRLNPGGSVIIRDGNKDLEDRHQGTRLSEFFSTKLFSFNKTTEQGLSFLSGTSIRQLAAQQGLVCEEIDTTKFTSNVIFVLRQERERAV